MYKIYKYTFYMIVMLFFASLSYSFADNSSPLSTNQFVDRIIPEGMTLEEFRRLDAEFRSLPEGLRKPSAQARTYVVGDREVFWTQSNGVWKQLTSECRKVTNEAYVFVSLTDNYNNPVYYTGYNAGYITQTDIDLIGTEFSTIYYKVKNAFGDDPVTGINGEKKVTILFLDIDDSYKTGNNKWGGFFYSTDTWTEQTASIYGHHSNERKMIYIDTYPYIESSSTPNTNHYNYGDYGINSAYLAIAHEFQHMIHNNQDSKEELWVNEGCSELAPYICGYELRKPENFSKAKDGDSLIEWKGENIDYEQVALFFLFIYEKFGEINTIKKIVSCQEVSTEGIETILKSIDTSYKFEFLYIAWSIANYTKIYSGIDLTSYSFISKESHSVYPANGAGYLSPWSTQYIEFTSLIPVKLTYSSVYNNPAICIADSSGITGFYAITSDGVSLQFSGSINSKKVLITSSFKDSDIYTYSAESLSKILYPSDSGISLSTGSSCIIKWTGFSGSYVNIYLCKDDNYYQTIVSNAINNGSYSWIIPTSLPSGNKYYIYIVSSTNTSDFYISDYYFSISTPAAVTYPSSTKIFLKPGSKYSITWTQFSGSYVKIDLYKGDIWNKTLFTSTYNDGTESWTIPLDQAISIDYKIKITSISSSSQYDFSDYPFSISNPVVLFPSSNNIILSPGSTYSIKWSGFSASYVKIQLQKNDIFNKTITSSTANDGEYSWTVPTDQINANDYRIKIINTTNYFEFDISDYPFSIGSTLTISLQSITGAETGNIIEIPIIATNASSLFSCFLQICFYNTDLDFFNLTGGSGTTFEWKRSSPDTVSINILKSNGFGSGTPTICTLRFFLKKGIGSTTVSIGPNSKFYKDDGNSILATYKPGQITINNGTTISGYRGDVNNDLAVDVRDALYVLRMATLASITVNGTIFQNPYNTALKYRGDVNGDGSVLSNDATAILRYSVGIKNNVYPISSAEKRVNNNPTLQLIKENISDNNILNLLLTIDAIEGVASGDIEIDFDPKILNFVSLSESQEMNDINYVYNIPKPGVLKIAMASAKGISKTISYLFSLSFTLNESYQIINEDFSSSISITDAKLWDEYSHQIYVNYLTTTLVEDNVTYKNYYSLYQNSPNPFNSSTMLSFYVPYQSQEYVILRIYDIRGTIIRNYERLENNGGKYSVIWDGTDNHGKKVSAGIYFCRMEAGNFSQVRKMIFLK